MRAGHLSIRDQGRQDQIMPAQDEDLPFVLNVESAFRITGRGTAVMGVIDQGTLHIGDHLEVIQPGSAATAAPLRVQCLGVDPAPRVTGRDPALGYPIAILIGPDIEPEAIQAGAKLQVAGPLTTVKSSLSRSLADSLPRRSGHVTGPGGYPSSCGNRAGISDRHLDRTRHRARRDPSRCQATSRRAISGPLTTVKSGLSRSLADSPPRRSGL